ncbi:MAG: ABC transporter permease [Candidatus Limnocylindria bacterium]
MTTLTPSETLQRRAWLRGSRGRHNAQLYAGTAIVGLVVLAAIAAPLLTGHDPIAQDLTATLQGPSGAHFLGTDNLGRDVWSRLLYGGRADLFVATIAVIVPFVVGSLVGALSGYFGGWFDTIVMRIADIVVAFPFYVLVISLVFILGNGVGSIFIAISLVSWVAYARIVRGETMIVRSKEFIEASLTGGLGTGRVIFRHVVPNVVTQAIVYAMSDIVMNIGVIVTLSYFGLGIVPPTPDWGRMMAEGQPFLAGGTYSLILLPGIAVVITSLGLSFVGDGLAHVLRVKR